MKRFLLCIAALSFYVNLHAKVVITGQVTDETTSPIIGAVVKLVTQTTLITQTVTNNEGLFNLTMEESDGHKELIITYIGYTDYRVSLENTQRNTDLGKIQLTPSTQELKGVEVVGKREIQKIDRRIITPSKLQLKASTNGVMLIQNMQLAGIRVNTIDNTITTTTGDAVQLRINGVIAKIEEVKALRPQDIVKVEYHDMPGLRFNGAAAVLDFIVKYKNKGGNINGDLTDGLSMLGYGENLLSANYHKGRSEIKSSFYWNRRDLKWKRENYEEYHYPHQTIENREIGEPTKVKFDNMSFSLWYNYSFKKSSISAIFRDYYNKESNSMEDRISTLYRGTDVYHITDFRHGHDNTPSLDLYFQTELAHNQHLYFDLIGTYINSHSQRTYTLSSTTQPTQTIASITDGNKYSIIGEGIYERMFKDSKLSFGLKHTQMYTNNTYDGNIQSQVNMNTAETFAYTEWMSKLGKLTYTLGLGGMRIYNHQHDTKLSKFILRPKLSLAYQPCNNVTLKYQGYVSAYAPSLSDMSNVSQDIDVYQLRKGNPNLKSVTFVSNELSLNWGTKWCDLSLFGRYSYDSHPIMEETYIDNGKFVRTIDNQKNFHRLHTQMDIRLHPFGDWLSLQLTPFFNRYISDGHTYAHTLSNWGLNGNLLAMYKQWVFTAQVQTRYNELWGETLTKGEANHAISVGYNKEKWTLNLIMALPFSKQYSNETDNLSRLAPNRQLAFSKSLRRILLLNFTFNLNYGKGKSSINKRISNSDNDSGIMYGR